MKPRVVYDYSCLLKKGAYGKGQSWRDAGSRNLATANFLGNKFIGANYGWVFCACGLDGILGPMLGGIVRDQIGNFLYAFVPAGVVCLIAACLGGLLRPVTR